MNKLTAALLLTLTLLAPAPAAPTQDGGCVFTRIIHSVRKNAREWTLERGEMMLLDEETGVEFVIYKWFTAGAKVEVIMLVNDTSEHAVAGFKRLSGETPMENLRQRVLPDKVPNLGDDSFTWEDYYTKTRMGVGFVKGNYVVHVRAPSMAVATQFATLIADELPK